ncbi:hypothetical protein D1816_12640 [Aquimarina sp. AD10]|uniref:alpha-ketoglutarate-dependent dioxygenase AlkB n=1 Tax=Aquimarina sp. AD10 TaxID=1714849 RepID=UPI000E4967E3|nr:alpha-ketoglutarate-dependent dioxygenase AlkB [Aquimarina sp. AD10]AXT61157.1 hypothetical protein D1816_12640 [Aquimarina sp. AD10]RKN02227.1 hypothetical protein D7033_01970 [Aquimarina sp. AD10]
MTKIGFHKIVLPLEQNLFNKFSNSIQFEVTGKGRVGNHLVGQDDKGIPLVRTTTNYNIPAYIFSSKHRIIIDSIKSGVDDIELSSLDFNNALIEIYEQNYTKMKYHSDQCLDVDKDSYIALFSCYERPDELSEQSIRKLKIKDKETNEESEILLTHNSVILFSVSTNSKYLHKIVLEQVKGMKPLAYDNRWLGITFRKSNTFIQFKDDIPYFPNREVLKLANENQRKEFFKLRGEENKNMNFIYPQLNYTLSLADTLPPKKT